MTDAPTVLVAELDGIRVPSLAQYRQATTNCFDLASKADVKVAVFPSAANGYYLMLLPLSSGRHSLIFGGQVGSLRQAISYDLVIE